MMRRRLRAACSPLAGVVLLLVVAPPALAQTTQTPEEMATARFRQGAEAYAHKDYRAAAQAFEAADAVLPAGATVYNAGLAWAAAGDPLRAANDFARAIELGGLGAAQATDAAQRLEAIDRDAGRLDVAGPAGAKVSIDGTVDALVPAHVRVAVGAHVITITRADGSTEARRTHVAKGASSRVEFGASPSPVGPPPPPLTEKPPPPKPTPNAEPPPPEPAPAGGPPIRRTLGWVGMGAGVGMGVVAVATGAAGLSAKNAFVAGGDHSQSEHDKAVSLRTVADVSWGVAGVLAATGVVLFVTAPKEGAAPSPPSAALVLGPVSLGVFGSF